MKRKILNYLKTKRWFIDIIMASLPSDDAILKRAKDLKAQDGISVSNSPMYELGFYIGAKWMRDHFIKTKNYEKTTL